MKKFNIAIILGILIVVAIAYIDTLGANVFGLETYTAGNFPSSFWILFRNMAIILMTIPALSYYLLYRKDKSEALAIFLIPLILWMFGVADILYFWLQGQAIPPNLPHLNNHLIMGRMATFFPYNQVTSQVLIFSAIAGIILTFLIVKYLKKARW